MSVFSVLPPVPDSLEEVVAAVDGLLADIGFPSVFVRGEGFVFSPRDGFVEVSAADLSGFCVPVGFFSGDPSRFLVEFLVSVRQLHASGLLVGGLGGLRFWNLLVDSHHELVRAFDGSEYSRSSVGRTGSSDRLVAQWLYSFERFLHSVLRDRAPVALTADSFFLEHARAVGSFASLVPVELVGFDDDRFGFPQRAVVNFWDECYQGGVDWRELFDDFIIERASLFSSEMYRSAQFTQRFEPEVDVVSVDAFTAEYTQVLREHATRVLEGFDAAAAGCDLTPCVLVVDGPVLIQARSWRTPRLTSGQLDVLYGAASFLTKDEGFWVFAGPRFVIDKVAALASHMVLPFQGPVVGDVTLSRLEVLRSLLAIDEGGVYGTLGSAWEAACDLA